jgi:hypothetical protein
MATISKSWAAEATIVNADAFTNTEEYSSDVDLETDGYEGAHVTISVAFHASGAQAVNIYVYGSLDGTTYDNPAMFSQQIALAAGATRQISLVVKDVAHFRIGYQTAAAEATNQPTMTIKQQRWRWASA